MPIPGRFTSWYNGKPILALRNTHTFQYWARGGYQLILFALKEPVYASVDSHLVLSGDIAAAARQANVTVIWWYAKRENVENLDFEQGTADTAKAPTFRDYEVVISSRATQGDAWVERRRAYPVTEEYTYTAAMNVADAGTFMPFLRFAVRVRDTSGFASPYKTLDVTVVS